MMLTGTTNDSNAKDPTYTAAKSRFLETIFTTVTQKLGTGYKRIRNIAILMERLTPAI